MKRFIFLIMVMTAACAACGDGGELERKFREYGLVDIATVDPSIVVELKYSQTDNFTGRDMYGPLERAYFVPEIAGMLAEVQRALRASHPGYSLVIYDAARPMSIQSYMFSLVAGTDQEKYVASPDHGGGYHNYGVAVDLSVLDERGEPLDMGSPFDCFEAIANVGDEAFYVETGRMTRRAMENRRMLAGLMLAAGFEQNPDEWWHFQKYDKAELMRRYRLLDF